mgnify:CR=1 FL=1
MVRPEEQGCYKVIAGLPCYQYNIEIVKKFLSQLDIKNEFITFDIETTTIDEHTNFMYVWMVCVANKFTMYGRRWFEWKEFIELLGSVEVKIFVHNLSYEFQYIRSILDFTESDVFCMKSRKVLKAKYRSIEFRCSYYLSNMSLDTWGKKLQIQHLKKDGKDFDYTKIRYPDSLLDEKELEYAITDVVSQYECIEKTLEIDGYTLKDLPLTSTGFVRNDAKLKVKKKRGMLKKLFPTLKQLKLLRETFRGGDTHANRYYVGQVLDWVFSYDRKSSYPDNGVNDKFPMTPFVEEISTVYRLKELCKNSKICWMATVELANIRLKHSWWGFPYIPVSKSTELRHYINDNGRVLEAEHLVISITDVDWKILEEEYLFDLITVRQLYSSRYGALPKEVRDVFVDYFQRKTELDGIPEQKVYYDKAKSKLNSVYGMMVQNPLKEDVIYAGYEYVKLEPNLNEKMEAYYKSGIWPYQWGVWITAWSRFRLHEGLWLAGEYAVYCDTDSVKTLVELDFSEFNKTRMCESSKNGGKATSRGGKTHFLGVFEQEPTYEKFISWGAKKYAYEIGGELKITIAGVSKKEGAKELSRCGGIHALRPGFVFQLGGGSESTYNDVHMSNVNINGHDIEMTANIAITPSTYTMSITDEYRQLLEDVMNAKMYSFVVDNV